jgi:hypothetical protein
MPAGHQKTVQEVTGSLAASGSIAPVWTGQRTETRFTSADAGSVDPIGPAGWQARAVKITAQPAQACSVLVEGGYISGDSVPPGYVAPFTPASFANGTPPYDPWRWQPIATVSFSAGVLKSQTVVVAPYGWVRVSVLNGATAQGAVTISEEFTDL